MADDDVSSEALKEKVEQLKKSSMKIGEAVYKESGSTDGGSAGGDQTQSANYEDAKEDKK